MTLFIWLYSGFVYVFLRIGSSLAGVILALGRQRFKASLGYVRHFRGREGGALP